MKAFVKRNKGKVIGGAAVLGTAATLALGSIAGQHDIDPDNGKIDIVIPGIEQPIQIPDIGGQVGDIISGVGEDIPIDTSLDPDYFGDKTIDPLPIVTPRDPEEIAETGVTAQDVLDLLDTMTLNIYKYPFYNYREGYGEYWDQITSQCHSFTTMSDSPVFYDVDRFTPSFIWFDKGEILETDELNEFRNVYLISLNYTAGLNNRGTSSRINRFAILKSDFVALMEVYNNEPYLFSEEDANKYSEYKFANDLIGYEVYPKIEFTRELIEQSNQEQLDALYNVITHSLIPINLENRVPEDINTYQMAE